MPHRKRAAQQIEALSPPFPLLCGVLDLVCEIGPQVPRLQRATEMPPDRQLCPDCPWRDPRSQCALCTTRFRFVRIGLRTALCWWYVHTVRASSSSHNALNFSSHLCAEQRNLSRHVSCLRTSPLGYGIRCYPFRADPFTRPIWEGWEPYSASPRHRGGFRGRCATLLRDAARVRLCDDTAAMLHAGYEQ